MLPRATVQQIMNKLNNVSSKYDVMYDNIAPIKVCTYLPMCCVYVLRSVIIDI